MTHPVLDDRLDPVRDRLVAEAIRLRRRAIAPDCETRACAMLRACVDAYDLHVQRERRFLALARRAADAELSQPAWLDIVATLRLEHVEFIALAAGVRPWLDGLDEVDAVLAWLDATLALIAEEEETLYGPWAASAIA